MLGLRKIGAAVLGVAGFFTVPVAAHAYSALYVFGDSLSDAGNLYAVTSTLSPPAEPAAPYYNGQFSNGPIWVEDVSASLGLGPVLPSVIGGDDYAYGGATTGYAATATPSSPVPTLTQQVATFISGLGGSAAPSSALYSVWIGANDLLNVVRASAALVGTEPLNQIKAKAASDAVGAAATEAAAIEALATKGADDFLVPLVPDLGLTPSLSGTSFGSATGTALAALYNASLEADLAGLSTMSGISLSFLDTFSLLDSAVADPAGYGLTDVTDPCYVGPYTGGGTVCATPGTYLFWDTLHPTAAGQQLIADAALAALPEPGAMSVLAFGLCGVLLLRRRAAPAVEPCCGRIASVQR